MQNDTWAFHYHLIQPLKNGATNHYFGLLTRSGPVHDDEQYLSSIAFICKKHRVKQAECIVDSFTLVNSPLSNF